MLFFNFETIFQGLFLMLQLDSNLELLEQKHVGNFCKSEKWYKLRINFLISYYSD